MKKTVFALTILSLFAFQFSVPAQQAVATNQDGKMFTDVPRDHWAYDAIDTLTRDGVMIGYFDKPVNTFRGDRTLTRYEFAYALAHAIVRIEENIRQEQKSSDIESYLKSKNVDPKSIELFSMLIQEFKTELNEQNIRITKLEEKTRSIGSMKIPLYISIAAALLSLVSLTIAIQK